MKLNNIQTYEIEGVEYSLAELTEFVRMAEESAKAKVRANKIEDHCYYVAKAIAETFYCHEDDIEEMNRNAEENELYSIAGTSVTFNTKTGKIEVQTDYFNEFDTSNNGRATIYCKVESFKDRVCHNYVESAKVFEIYNRVFDKDYHCSWEWREGW